MGSIGENNNKNVFPKVDFSGLVLVEPGMEAWERVQAEVEEALRKYGGFDVIYNDIEAEIQSGIIVQAMLELFKQDAKYSYAPPLPSSGHWSSGHSSPPLSGIAFKSLELENPEFLDNVREYAKNIWPQGNEFFCNTMYNYAKHMEGLLQKIHRMILMSMDLEDYYDSHIKSVAYSMRVSKYFKGVRDDKERIVFPSHVETTYVSIIYQHKIEGLEVESSNHEWIRVLPFPNSFTVLLGESFKAWTNGRYRAPNHRVKLGDTEERYSIIFCSIPSQSNDMIQVLDELVDNKHPRLYKPFKYYDYLKFRFSNREEEDHLKSYCGVEQAKATT